MFQSFETAFNPEFGADRLASLRAVMAEQNLSAYLVPRSDAHMGEYVAPCDERLAWLTGFSGSAGFCAVLADRAGVFIDGRYTLQVVDQVDTDHFTPIPWPKTQLHDWLLSHLTPGSVVGFDPWLHTVQDIRKLTKSLAAKNIVLRPTDNLIDQIRTEQPARPNAPITAYPLELSGKSAKDKITDILGDAGIATGDHIVLTLPDSICWLLNIRGSDVSHTPIAHCFATIAGDGSVALFTDATLTPEISAHLGKDITVLPYAGFGAYLAALSGGTALIDPASAPQAILDYLDDSLIKMIEAPDPCQLPKARKNPVEISSTTKAHLRDGAAMCEFLCWLDRTLPQGELTEIDVVKRLESFRRATNMLQDISFETICGSGPNGSIVHYRVTESSNRAINPGELLLVDSGGQYLDGTTDITRTIAVGQVGEAEKSCFTRVLQGMIAMSRACWPKGLAGQHLDAIARVPLWQAGLDYDHGTGHGVGAYLSVHEGPARLSRTGDIPLDAGMILSNEPGYYRAGQFGIRIENLILVEEAPDLTAIEDRQMLRFRTLTHVPIDKSLIQIDMLSQAERDWLNTYHQATFDMLFDHVSADCKDWLRTACAAL